MGNDRPMKKVVIDTDAGVDDAVALLIAINLLPKGSILAVTSVFGNVDLPQANYNISKILQVSHQPDIPVYSGAYRPLLSGVEVKWDGHGADGLGGAVGIAPNDPPKANDAVHALIKLAKENPKELTVVAIGPATNVALAIALDPSFVDNVKEVIYMGCTTDGRGNTTPHAEFNVACDPEAAHMMLTAFAGKITVVSWETVCEHHLPWAFYDYMCGQGTKAADFIKRICASYEAHSRLPEEQEMTEEDMYAQRAFILCDAYAMALLLEDFIIESKLATGRVELNDGETRGACHWTDEKDASKAVKIVLKFDRTRFQHILLSLAQSYELPVL